MRGSISLPDQTELLAHTWEPVLIFDLASGTLMYLNRAAEETFGYAADEALGRNVHELLSTTPDVQQLRADLERAERWSGELSHRRKDGARIDVEARIAVLKQPGGRDVAVESARTIGERRAMEEALRARTAELVAAETNRNAFLALLAHELRNPLGALRNLAQVFRTPSASPESIDRIRVIMNRQIRHMARMIDDLLDVARIAQGQIELHREPVDLTVVLERAIEATRDRIEEREQRLSLSLTDEAVTLDGDTVRLEQVFVNLLSNAAKFNHPGGQIWLSTEVLRSARGTAASAPVHPHVVVRLRDEGIGIGEAMLPRVFDLFVPAERSPERVEGGLGLGLNLVKQVVELHGGTVEASSAGPDMGSEFIVRLPMLENPVGPDTLKDILQDG